MARQRKSASEQKSDSKNTTNTEGIKMAERGTLTSLQMLEVTDEELSATHGGRGHGEYDTFLEMFIEAGIRGTKVGFSGVKPNSIKTGLKGAIERAVKNNKVADGELQVRGKDESVYLVRIAGEEA